MTPTSTKSWQHRTIYQVVQNKQLRTVSLHSSTASASKSSQGFPSLVWKILFPLFFLYFLLVVGTEYNYITCSITIYMWITLSSNLLRSPRILKQTTPTCSNLRDGVPRYFPAKPEVCDLGSHFTKDAAEDLLLPTWQGEGFTTREGMKGFFQVIFWYLREAKYFGLDLWRVLGSWSVTKTLKILFCSVQYL